MPLSKHIVVAARSLRRASLRSALALLGIVIGVAAVIATLSIGAGAKAQVERILLTYDPNVLAISATAPVEKWVDGQSPRLRPGEGMLPSDYFSLRRGIPQLLEAGVQANAPAAQVRGNGRKTDGQVVGIDASGFRLLYRMLLAGSYFSEYDVHNARNKCVVTQTIANQLFGGRTPVGRFISLNGVPFTIVGVVNDDPAFQNMQRINGGDVEIFIPFTSLLRRIDNSTEIVILLKATDTFHLADVERNAKAAMERHRGKRTADFTVSNRKAAIETFTQASRTLAILVATIGGVSLLIGGIGIMNIMLVNVTERTREIGIRIAIGTRAADIQRQFLSEAVVLCAAGGLLGVAVGCAAALFTTRFNAWPTQLTVSSIVVGFLCSVGVGIFFGYYPARHASKLDPVIAIRTE